MRALALLGLLAACGGDDGPPPSATSTGPAVDPYDDCDLDWERDVAGFFDNWCAPCHSEAIPPEWRQGAPEGVDLDSLDDVRLWAERVRATALGDAPVMPPAGGTSQAERDLVTAWLDCGMPGTEVVPVDPCEGVPTVALGAGDDPAGLCAGGGLLVVDGDLSIDATQVLDCACAVTGDLTLAAPLTAGALARVDGDLVVRGAASLDAPELADVGGDLEITALSVDNLYLDSLRTVGGAVHVHDTEGLLRLSLGWLRSAGGPLTVEQAPALIQLAMPRLATVPGDVRFEGLPVLASLESLVALQTLEGALIVRDTGVVHLDDLRGWERIDGGIVVEANPELLSIDGFWHLTELTTLTVVGNPQLASVTGFDVLPAADRVELRDNPVLTTLELPLLASLGTLGSDDEGLLVTDAPGLDTVAVPELRTLAGLRLVRTGLVDLSAFAAVEALGTLAVVDNAALEAIDAPALPVRIAGTLVEANPVLARVALPAVAHGEGGLTLRDNPELASVDLSGLAALDGALVLDGLPGLEGLEGVAGLATVAGDLELTELAQLTSLQPLHGLASVGGDLVVRDNPVLPAAEVDALVEAIDSLGGAVDASGNAP